MRKKSEQSRDISLISQNPSIPEKTTQGSASLPGEIDDRLLRVNEAARLLAVSVGTLYHMASERRVPCVRLSARCLRFPLSAIQEWLEGLSEPASKGPFGRRGT